MTPRGLFRALLPAACAVCLWLGLAADPAAAGPGPADTAALSARIDAGIEAVWQRDGIKPAAPATDAEFLRRVYLSTVGVPPTRPEAEAFLADTAPGKRAALIDRLLADERFGRHLADLWMPILRERGNDLGELGVSAGDVMAVWLAGRFNADTPFNQTITDIVTAQGPISRNPPSAYYALMGFPPPVADMAGLTLRNFAGMQIQCAQCHDHHYEPAWTQQAFAGVAGFFSSIEITADFYTQPVDPAVVTRDLPPRAVLQALLKQPAIEPETVNRINDLLAYDQPRLPGDRPVKTRDAASWRRMMAAWLTSPSNTTAMKYQVNRFWSFLFGRGLVHPVDDFNSLNTPTHPQLLDDLAADWVAGGFRVKRLYRAILNTRAWQLSGRGADPKAQHWHFAAWWPRPLTPEQFFGALFTLVDGDGFVRAFARQTQNAYQKLGGFAALQEQQKKQGIPPGEYDPKFNHELLRVYEQRLEQMGPLWQIRRGLAARYAQLSSDDERAQTEGFTGSMDQALMILNGEVTRRLGGSLNGSLVFAVMRDFSEDSRRVEALYLSVLSRRPDARELERALAAVKAAPAPAQGYEDLFFALISTTEFATNH
ncbi:MAG: DUF1549 domain-containing protein [Planctomycetes bacterium]|nr:DUF1549 domain-containing protein [Planctomycetota bacterium]MCL4730930.1 DUF1549 domain-containing protein [Planctomycetota bacterium]